MIAYSSVKGSGMAGEDLPSTIFYKDPVQDQVMGPYSEREMMSWYRAGYFDSRTEFCLRDDGLFEPLEVLRARNGAACPFAENVGQRTFKDLETTIDSLLATVTHVVDTVEAQRKKAAENLESVQKQIAAANNDITEVGEKMEVKIHSNISYHMEQLLYRVEALETENKYLKKDLAKMQAERGQQSQMMARLEEELTASRKWREEWKEKEEKREKTTKTSPILPFPPGLEAVVAKKKQNGTTAAAVVAEVKEVSEPETTPKASSKKPSSNTNSEPPSSWPIRPSEQTAKSDAKQAPSLVSVGTSYPPLTRSASSSSAATVTPTVPPSTTHFPAWMSKKNEAPKPSNGIPPASVWGKRNGSTGDGPGSYSQILSGNTPIPELRTSPTPTDLGELALIAQAMIMPCAQYKGEHAATTRHFDRLREALSKVQRMKMDEKLNAAFDPPFKCIRCRSSQMTSASSFLDHVSQQDHIAKLAIPAKAVEKWISYCKAFEKI